jgi:hypothetical protein
MLNSISQSRYFPITLFALCLVSFGLLIPWLGFYWDDWPAIWFLHFLGPSGFVDVFASDRPLLGRLFWATTSLLGESTLAWQLFGFTTRWLSALALWWTLRSVWPKHIREVTWVVILFVIYPGFSQQFISVTYSHVFLIQAIFFVSLGIMISAIRKPRWFWLLTSFSIILAAYTMFSLEYYFGLELLRPVLLWIVLGEQIKDRRKRLSRTFIYWIPYLLLMPIFLIWRIFIQDTPRGEVQIFSKILVKPLAWLIDLLQEIGSDMVQSSVIAWGQTLNFLNLNNFGLLPTLLYIVVVMTVAAVTFFYLYNYLKGDSQKSLESSHQNAWAWQAVLIGIFALFIGGWPFWSTNLPIELRFPWDRFTIPMMLGASLLLVGIIDLVLKSHTLKVIILSVLVGLAVGHHYQNANLYRREWNSQKAFFWQLSWRAPEIKPGTMILGSELPFVHFSDNSLTAPFNWTYVADNLLTPMPYLIYAIESRLGNEIQEISMDQRVDEPYRATYFTGSTSQALVLYHAPPGCVKILDPEIDARLPQKPKYMSEAMALSDLSLISDTSTPASPPNKIFGPEPEHDWCYYFEKAELARQYGDWTKVVELAEQARQLDTRLYEVNAPELLPYIEGYAHLGDWDNAHQLTDEAYQLTFRMERILCSTWQRILQNTPSSPERQSIIKKLGQELECDLP